MENDVKMLIVHLGKKRVSKADDIIAALRGINNITYVDAVDALYRRLPEPDYEAFGNAYFHWSVSPRKCLDTHPNPLAHEIIASEVFKHIELEKSKDNGDMN
ncbi:MAG: hypothetical protein GY854_30850 [Deltaproteobacteria bacterium]|nr:hypothetical protein [Deltaproteobacteria bacterium]